MDSKANSMDSVSLVAAQLVETQLQSSEVRLHIRSASMSPALREGDLVRVKRADHDKVRVGDIVVVKSTAGLVAHRLVARTMVNGEPRLIAKGDNCIDADAPCEPAAVVGTVATVRRAGREKDLQSIRSRMISWLQALLSYTHGTANQGGQSWPKKVISKALRLGLRTLAALSVLLLALVLVFPGPAANAAVKISAFLAQSQGNQIRVTWTTGSEINNAGFNLLRSTSKNGAYSKINSTIIPSKCLGCMVGSDYAYVDGSASSGQIYYYKLQSIETSGNAQDFGPVSASVAAAPATSTVLPSRTPTRLQTIALEATRAPNTEPATRAVLPGTPTATRAQTSVNESSVKALGTPPSKVAYAVSLPSSELTPAADAHGAANPNETTPPVPAVGIVRLEEADLGPEVDVVEQPTSVESGVRTLSFAVFGLAGLLGCSSFLSAFLAVVLLVRATGHR